VTIGGMFPANFLPPVDACESSSVRASAAGREQKGGKGGTSLAALRAVVLAEVAGVMGASRAVQLIGRLWVRAWCGARLMRHSAAVVIESR
jgi:hypothetical protein